MNGHELLRQWFDKSETLSQRRFAQVADFKGLSQARLSDLSVGRGHPTLAQAILLRDVCGIPIETWCSAAELEVVRNAAARLIAEFRL